MGGPLVTVSVPMWRSEDTIDRAIEGLLAQTVAARIVVVSDGEDPEVVDRLVERHSDERLVVTRTERNVGRYAIDHHVLLDDHTDTEWFTVHDADDWADPDWLEQMLAVTEPGTDAVLADHWRRAVRGGPEERCRAKPWDGSKRFDWHAHMAGLYRTEWLRQTRITNPHVRVAWDSFLTGAVQVLGNVEFCREPRYHRVRRPGSLTTSRETGMQSPMRKELTPRIKAAWERLVDDPSCHGKIVDSFRPERGINDLLFDRALFPGVWALDRGSAAELDAALWAAQPSLVVEAGSGHSTLVCARYARLTGARVISLEGEKLYHRRTLELLRAHGLADAVDLRHSPLDGQRPPWYVTDLPDGIDFVVLDGPREQDGGRAAAFDALRPHLAETWTMFMDDTDRQAENAIAEDIWLAHDAWLRRRSTSALLSSRPMPGTLDASDVCVTILTGHRPHLLRRTLESLPPDLMHSATVYALHTGRDGDDETSELLDKFSECWIDQRFSHHEMRTLGDNTSELAAMAKSSGSKFWLHIEDDWVYDTHCATWLDESRDLLDADPAVAHVRLRHCAEKVLTRHMVTRRPIQWRSKGAFHLAEAHITTNPSLVRVADIDKLYPAEGERHTQRQGHSAGMRTVAQHLPGAWRHIGDGESLRAITRCPA